MDDLESGWALFMRGEYGSAEAVFRAVLDDATSSADTRLTANFNIGYCLAHTGRFDEARTLYGHLRRDAQASGNPSLEHMALHQMGMVERMAGNWPAARACFQEERHLIAALGDDHLAVAVNAHELGWVALHLGHLSESREHFETSLTRAQQTTDHVALACAHRGLGDWHAAAGNGQNASGHWQTALDVFRATGDDSGARGIQERLDGADRIV